MIPGKSYVKVHKEKGYQYGPREFIEVTEFGYYTFVGPQEGQVMSESPEIWNFYLIDDESLPIAVTYADGCVEGPNGPHKPETRTIEQDRIIESIPTNMTLNDQIKVIEEIKDIPMTYEEMRQRFG